MSQTNIFRPSILTYVNSVGTRFVKVWRVESGTNVSPNKAKLNLDSTVPSPQIPLTVTRTLAGRNCLLGPLVDTTFTCVASISDSMAVACSERGDICMLDDNDSHKLVKVAQAAFGITSMAVDVEGRLVVVGGRDGLTKTVTFEELLKPRTSVISENDTAVVSNDATGGQLCALAFVHELSIAVNSRHAIVISRRNASAQIGNPATALLPPPLPAHRDVAVLGIRLMDQPNQMDNASFFTWTSAGEIIFWDMDGQNKYRLDVEIEQAPVEEDTYQNQCQIVRASTGAGFLAIGDRQGSLQILDLSTRKCEFNAKAHGSEIQDIALYEGKSNLLATCSRDRTVQLFRRLSDGSWALMQTMEEHTANVCNVAFSDDGQMLISASSDRTIQIRQLISRDINGQDVTVAIPTRVITVKASPVSMTISLTPNSGYLTISMMDRTVATYETSSGKLVFSFRATDTDGNDAVVMDALVIGKPSAITGRPTVLAGISGTDKSVRIYDANTGLLLGREWGHTAAVTDVALLETNERTALISTASDGTIMLWDMSTRATDILEQYETPNGDREQSPPKEYVPVRPPLRRVLSKAELAEFQRQSPTATPTGKTSPPNVFRRKTSRYSAASNSPRLVIPPVSSMPANHSISDDSNNLRGCPRARSRSPPSPKPQVNRRPSLAEIRGRPKSASGGSEFGTLNMATEQACRTLRAYRKKLSSVETVRAELLKDLDQELRLTAKALGEKSLKTKSISETVLDGLLDQYSERLVSIFDEKLRLNFILGTTPESVQVANKLPAETQRISDGPG